MGRGKRRDLAGITLGEARRPQPALGDARINLGDSSPRLTKVFPKGLMQSLVREAPPRQKPPPRPQSPSTQPVPGARALQGRTIVPTGGITGIVRGTVIPMLQDAGANAYDDAKYINSNTVVLVSGIQAKNWQNRTNMSSKLKKAEQVGAKVEIVTGASDFQDILSGRRPI